MRRALSVFREPDTCIRLACADVADGSAGGRGGGGEGAHSAEVGRGVGGARKHAALEWFPSRADSWDAATAKRRSFFTLRG